jgi:hypothetical protein
MKNFLFILFISLFLSGCISTYPDFYSVGPNTDYTILGSITYIKKLGYFFGHPHGGVSFKELLNSAKSQYTDCDYVINVTIDKELRFTPFIFFFFDVEYQMQGTAIRYNRNSQPDTPSTD